MGDTGAHHLGTAEVLAKAFRVIVPDQIGHGNSDRPALTYRIRTFSDFNKGLLDALGITRVHVVGESLGGWIAADMALRFPQAVDHLVLVDSAGVQGEGRTITEKDLPQELYITSIYDQRKLLERLFLHKQIVTDRMVEAAFREHLQSGDAPVVANILQGVLHTDEWLDARAAGIKAPTLIVWCKQDELLDPAGADVLHAKIPNSKIVLLDGCGHVPAAESPRAFFSSLMDFLAK